MFYTQTSCFKYFAGFPTKNEWYVWISGWLVPCICMILIVLGLQFLQSWNLLASKPRCFELDTKSGWAVQTVSVLWMGRQIAMCGSRAGTLLGWRSRLVAQAAQDFTQSKMMHPAVGKAKTETGRCVYRFAVVDPGSRWTICKSLPLDCFIFNAWHPCYCIM